MQTQTPPAKKNAATFRKKVARKIEIKIKKSTLKTISKLQPPKMVE